MQDTYKKFKTCGFPEHIFNIFGEKKMNTVSPNLNQREKVSANPLEVIWYLPSFDYILWWGWWQGERERKKERAGQEVEWGKTCC